MEGVFTDCRDTAGDVHTGQLRATPEGVCTD
jgi:hypothetical protein